MKLSYMEIDGIKFKIICANVFDTNDCFKAMMVVDVSEIHDITKLSTIESSNFAIYGIHFDYSNVVIDPEMGEKITIDFEEINENWALCYVCV